MTELCKKILELRDKGYSYNRISKELKCGKSTVTYYCNTVYRENILKQYRYGGKYAKQNTKKLSVPKTLQKKYHDMQRRHGLKAPFTLTELYNKFKDDGFCYLTKEPIDLSLKSSYVLEHIVPFSKGGALELDNIQIATIKANNMKGNLELNEFLQLCSTILHAHRP